MRVGDTVSVVSTVEREFREKTLIQLFFNPLKSHQDFPHFGEIWIDGKSIASMTPTNEFTLAGSFSATQEICDKAKGAIEGSIDVKLLAFNRMFKVIPTSNFVGGFELTCTSDLQVTVPISETLTDANSVELFYIEPREVTGGISTKANLTIDLETNELRGLLTGEGRAEEKVGCRVSSLDESFDDDEATVSYELTYYADVFGTYDTDNNFSIEIQPVVSYISKAIKPYTHDFCKQFNPQLEWETSDLLGDGIISGTIVDRTVSLKTDWVIVPLGGWHVEGEGQGVAQGK